MFQIASKSLVKMLEHNQNIEFIEEYNQGKLRNTKITILK